MEDKSLFNSEQPKTISEGLQNFIDSMVEEIVLVGKPFDTQKKYLRKFSENEGLDYEKLEADITTFIEILDSLKTAFSKLQAKLAKEKGCECYISKDMLDKLIKHCSSVREIGDTDVAPKSIFKKRKLLRKATAVYAGLLYIAIVASSVLLDVTHGPLTPRGNRYASWSFSDFDWVVLILMNVAYIFLLLPWLKYAFNKSRDIFSMGIFPATTVFSKTVSVLLTLFSMVSGMTYTVLHIVYSINRMGGIILDEERIIIMVCYTCCIVFWAVVCVVYKFAYRKW
jgi:hypothetical protein